MTPEEIRAEVIETIARADHAHIEAEHAAKQQRPPRTWDEITTGDRDFHRGLAVVATDALAAAGMLPIGTETAIPLAGPGGRRERYYTGWREIA